MAVTVPIYKISPDLMPLIYPFPRILALCILRHQDTYFHLINIAVTLLKGGDTTFMDYVWSFKNRNLCGILK